MAGSQGKGFEFDQADWERRGAGVLAAAARWERNHLPGSTPVALEDTAEILLTALPLVRLPEDARGSCAFTVEADPDQDITPRSVALWVNVVDGRIAAQGKGRPLGRPAGWASGSIDAWDSAIIDNELDALRIGGKREFVQALVEQVHTQLYDYK